MAHTRIRNEWLERHQFTLRILCVGVVGLLLLATVAIRLFYLQVMHHSHYVILAENNRLREEPVTPPRGLIYDRNGVLLAENRPSYELVIVPEQVPDMQATIAALGKIVHIEPDDINRFDSLLATRRPFQPLPLRTELSTAEVARFAADRQDFPGVDIRATLSRYYPLGAAAAQAVGYVGMVSTSELDKLNPAQYTSTSEVGKVGVEAFYEQLLHGSVGTREVETDAQGRPVRVVSYTPPVPGSDLYLSIDMRLQEAAEQALGDNNGAVVAINPQNGEVLALVSSPSYDPNPFVDGISQEKYAALSNDPNRPLFNRVLRGQYPPGSTLKPFVALAALNYHRVNPLKKVYGPAVFYIPGSHRPYRNWDPDGCGQVDLAEAIMVSCDTYFYSLGLQLGISDMHRYLVDFGFGQPTGIDLPHENTGLIPSPAWKRRMDGHAWYLGNTAITAIGQGFVLVTPLQLASATATLSMQGKRYAPRIVMAVKNPLTGALKLLPPQPMPSPPEADSGAWKLIIHSMREVVANPAGTAHAISYGAKFSIAAKTGTAQVVAAPRSLHGEGPEMDLPKKLRDNAMFIAFAPVDHPRIAVAVVVEHGGYGAATAAPIARKVLDAYLLHTAGGNVTEP